MQPIYKVRHCFGRSPRYSRRAARRRRRARARRRQPSTRTLRRAKRCAICRISRLRRRGRRSRRRHAELLLRARRDPARHRLSRAAAVARQLERPVPEVRRRHEGRRSRLRRPSLGARLRRREQQHGTRRRRRARRWFAFDNRQAEIDFGYRAVHLTANAGKAVVAAYYERPGGAFVFRRLLDGRPRGAHRSAAFPERLRRHRRRRARVHLPRAERGPHVAAAAPVPQRPRGHSRFRRRRRRQAREPAQARHSSPTLCWRAATERRHQGRRHRRAAQVRLRAEARSLASICAPTTWTPTPASRRRRSRRSRTSIAARTTAAAPRSSRAGVRRRARLDGYIPQSSNQMFPTISQLARPHGVPVLRERSRRAGPRANDLTYVPDKKATPPEWAWWEFDIDDSRPARRPHEVADERDGSRSRAVSARGEGKLILWHGWNDAGAPPGRLWTTTTRRRDDVRRRPAPRASTRACSCFPAWGIAEGVQGRTLGTRSRRWLNGWRTARRPTLVAGHTTDGRVDNERLSARIRRSRATRDPPAAERPANWIADELHLPLGCAG